MSIESQTSQVNEWVCIYRFAPGDECRETFSTRKVCHIFDQEHRRITVFFRLSVIILLGFMFLNNP